MLFVATTLPLAKRGHGAKVVAQPSSSFNRPRISVVVFCSGVFKGHFYHGAMQIQKLQQQHYRIDCSL